MKNGILIGVALVATVLVSVGLASGDKPVPLGPSPAKTQPFLEVGKVYLFEVSWVTRSSDGDDKFRGKVVDPPQDGWVRVEFVGDAKQRPNPVWINLNRVDAVMPLEPGK